MSAKKTLLGKLTCSADGEKYIRDWASPGAIQITASNMYTEADWTGPQSLYNVSTTNTPVTRSVDLDWPDYCRASVMAYSYGNEPEVAAC